MQSDVSNPVVGNGSLDVFLDQSDRRDFSVARDFSVERRNEVFEEAAAQHQRPNPDEGSPVALQEARRCVSRLQEFMNVVEARLGDGAGLGFDAARDSAAAAPGSFAAFKPFLAGCHRNLKLTYETLKLPFYLPDVSAVHAAGEADGVQKYLERLRCYYKAIIGGFNAIRPACQELERSLDPADIELEARRTRRRPWDVYKDRHNRMPEFHVYIFERLQTTVKNYLRRYQLIS